MSTQNFEQEVCNAHNRYRAKHGAPPLRLDPKLNSLAKDWAQYLLRTNSMKHRPNSGYGENIYMTAGSDLSAEAPVKAWYDEIKMYNYHYPVFQSNTGHFTQLVWRDSKELGVGFARRGNTIYVVCNYNPPGNYMNKFRENVAPRSDA